MNKQEKKLPGNYPERKAILWTYIVYITFVFLTSVIGYVIFGFVGIIAIPIFLWLINFMITGWINRPTEYSVIERFGSFYKIVGPGLNWHLFLIDSVVKDPFGKLPAKKSITTRRRKVYLFSDGYKNKEEMKEHLHYEIRKLDFSNVFGVDSYISHFGGVGLENGESEEELFNDIYNFLYRYRDVRMRIVSIADSYFREQLQRKTMEEANVIGLDLWNLEGVSETEKEKVLKDFEEIGWRLEDRPFLLEDIGIPEDTVKASQDAFAAKKKGEGELDRFKAGTFGPLLDLMKSKEEGGPGYSKEKAAEIFLSNKSMNTIEKISNPTLIVGEGGLPKVLDVSGMTAKSSNKDDKNNS